MMNSQEEILQGEVYEIIYQNEENGYTVCEIETNKSLTTACGIMPFVAPGEQVNSPGNGLLTPTTANSFTLLR